MIKILPLLLAYKYQQKILRAYNPKKLLVQKHRQKWHILTYLQQKLKMWILENAPEEPGPTPAKSGEGSSRV